MAPFVWGPFNYQPFLWDRKVPTRKLTILESPFFEINILKYLMWIGSSIPIFGGIIGQGLHFAHLQV